MGNGLGPATALYLPQQGLLVQTISPSGKPTERFRVYKGPDAHRAYDLLGELLTQEPRKNVDVPRSVLDWVQAAYDAQNGDQEAKNEADNNPPRELSDFLGI